MRRLTGDEDLTSEFATTWRTYELDAKTRSLLEYAEKLTKAPGMIDDGDIDALRAAGRSEDAIYEASALISFFNFTGRMEAASGLPADEVPAGARPPKRAPAPAQGAMSRGPLGRGLDALEHTPRLRGDSAGRVSTRALSESGAPQGREVKAGRRPQRTRVACASATGRSGETAAHDHSPRSVE